MIRPWETLAGDVVTSTEIFELRRVKRRSGQTGVVAEFHIVQFPAWVNVIALTPENEVILIRQYRHGTGEVTLEIPGGIVDSGESPAEAAARELVEETGYTGSELELLGRVRPNPAIQTNSCYTYLISSVQRTRRQSLERNEEIEVELRSLSSVQTAIRTGEITHALVIAAFYFLEHSGRMRRI